MMMKKYPKPQLLEKPILHFDLDGVIAGGSKEEVYSDKAGWAYEKCHLLEGAKEGLESLAEKYDLILSTARRVEDTEVTMEWLKTMNILHLFKEVRVGEKPLAIAYIDDRGYHFTSWGTLMKEFD